MLCTPVILPSDRGLRLVAADLAIDSSLCQFRCQNVIGGFRFLELAAIYLYSTASDVPARLRVGLGSPPEPISFRHSVTVPSRGSVEVIDAGDAVRPGTIYRIVSSERGLPTRRFWWILTLIGVIADEGAGSDRVRTMARIIHSRAHRDGGSFSALIADCLGRSSSMGMGAADMMSLCATLVRFSSQIRLPAGIPAGVISQLVLDARAFSPATVHPLLLQELSRDPNPGGSELDGLIRDRMGRRRVRRHGQIGGAE